jgi:hypothetical protein
VGERVAVEVHVGGEAQLADRGRGDRQVVDLGLARGQVAPGVADHHRGGVRRRQLDREGLGRRRGVLRGEAGLGNTSVSRTGTPTASTASAVTPLVTATGRAIEVPDSGTSPSRGRRRRS